MPWLWGSLVGEEAADVMITSGGEKPRGIQPPPAANELVFWTSDILDYCFFKFILSRPLCHRRKSSWVEHGATPLRRFTCEMPQGSARAHSIPGFSSDGQMVLVMLLLPHSMRLPTFYPQEDWEYEKASEQKEQRVAPSKMNINSLRTRIFILFTLPCLCPTKFIWKSYPLRW